MAMIQRLKSIYLTLLWMATTATTSRGTTSCLAWIPTGTTTAVTTRAAPRPPTKVSPIPKENLPDAVTTNRRHVLGQFLLGLTTTTSSLTVAIPATTTMAHAVMMESKQDVFQAGQALGIQAAKERFILARKSLQYLLDNYDSVVQGGGGDNVRRYLGTVGTTSGLWGIDKVLKELQEEANDIVEFTENMSDFAYYLRAADTAVYSSIFVEYSSAKTKPEQYFKDAQKDIQNMKVYMDRMADDLKL